MAHAGARRTTASPEGQCFPNRSKPHDQITLGLLNNTIEDSTLRAEQAPPFYETRSLILTPKKLTIPFLLFNYYFPSQGGRLIFLYFVAWELWGSWHEGIRFFHYYFYQTRSAKDWKWWGRVNAGTNDPNDSLGQPTSEINRPPCEFPVNTFPFAPIAKNCLSLFKKPIFLILGFQYWEGGCFYAPSGFLIFSTTFPQNLQRPKSILA